MPSGILPSEFSTHIYLSPHGSFFAGTLAAGIFPGGEIEGACEPFDCFSNIKILEATRLMYGLEFKNVWLKMCDPKYNKLEYEAQSTNRIKMGL